MEFMIWPPTRAGSTSGSTTTRRPSRFRRSADGGKTSAVLAIRSRAAWSSPPMAAGRTARACDCGNLNCNASPMNSHYQSRSIICRREPANGARSSIACSHSFSQNWRARPLLSYRVIVELIGATTTRTGLTVRCELDDKPYPKGIVVSDEVMRNLNIQHADFYGEWNYAIAPSTPHIKAVDS